jgi:hypothetical protein
MDPPKKHKDSSKRPGKRKSRLGHQGTLPDEKNHFFRGEKRTRVRGRTGGNSGG